jgi:hypothetical protein
MTVQGRVVGPDGQPVQDAWIFSRIILGPSASAARLWNRNHGIARHGRFELHGVDPDAEVPVHFLEARRKLGATVQLSGKLEAGEPITVRLEPCGSATARLVDAAGKPVSGWRVGPLFTTMVITPGPSRNPAQTDSGRLLADEGALNAIDPINYGEPVVSDANGRITLPALIPGASYRFQDRTTFRDPAGPRVRKEFTVQPGKTFDLGDIRIEKPQSMLR